MFLHEMQGEALTSQIKNLSTRILLAKQLLMILHIEVSQPKRIAEVMKAVSELNSFRNNLVHGPWGLYDMTHHDVTHHFWEKTKVDGSNFKPKTFRVKRQDVLDNVKRVRETREVLAKLTGSIVSDFLREIEHVPWPEKLRRRERRRRRTRGQTRKWNR